MSTLGRAVLRKEQEPSPSVVHFQCGNFNTTLNTVEKRVSGISDEKHDCRVNGLKLGRSGFQFHLLH